MIRVVGRKLLAATAATLLFATACRDAQSPEPRPSLLPGLPAAGAIVVSTVTSGSLVDPDGYTVTVDDGPSQHIAPTGVVAFTGLAIGNHTVTLSDVAANCSVDQTVTVTVPVLGSVSTTFTVECAPSPPPSTGDLAVTTSTTATSGASSDLDPDGYTVTLDGATSQAIGINATVTFTGLTPGSHSVVLSGVASNCTVSDGTSRTVSVTAGSTATASFSASCAPAGSTTGSLTVTTATSGASADLDPDGYTVSVDGTASQPISTNGSVSFTGPAGEHQVELSGMAANCAVNGANPRPVTVPAGGTTSTTFDVSCAAEPPPPPPPPAGRVTGRGQIGSGSPTPGSDAQTFDFDVRADLSGRFTGTDWSFLHSSGTPATVTVDRAADPETSITAFQSSSSACSDPGRGVEFDGVGREDTGRLLTFHVTVCDNGSGIGTDFFRVQVPSDGYDKSGVLTGGDIVKS